MTRPIFEPSTSRTEARLGFTNNQLLRRPSSSGDCCTAWMVVYDNLPYGQEINSADGTVNLEYPYVDWSDNAVGIFDYVRSASTIGATNNYNIQLLVDGVYTFSWAEVSEDLAASNYAVKYFLEPGMNYPGRNSSQDPVDIRVYTYDFRDAANTARSYSTTYTYILDSITLPCQRFNENPGTIYPYVQIMRPATAADFDIVLRNRLWVVYHGPLEHAVELEDNRDPYPDHPGD